MPPPPIVTMGGGAVVVSIVVAGAVNPGAKNEHRRRHFDQEKREGTERACAGLASLSRTRFSIGMFRYPFKNPVNPVNPVLKTFGQDLQD